MTEPLHTETGRAPDIELVFDGPPVLTAEAAAILARIIRKYRGPRLAGQKRAKRLTSNTCVDAGLDLNLRPPEQHFH